MALPELACDRRLDPAHRALSSVPGRAFSSLPLPTGADPDKGEDEGASVADFASASDPSSERKTKLTWNGNSASAPAHLGEGRAGGGRTGWVKRGVVGGRGRMERQIC